MTSMPVINKKSIPNCTEILCHATPVMNILSFPRRKTIALRKAMDGSEHYKLPVLLESRAEKAAAATSSDA